MNESERGNVNESEREECVRGMRTRVSSGGGMRTRVRGGAREGGAREGNMNEESEREQ